MAFATLLTIQALLVGLTVVLLRPRTASLAARMVGGEVVASDLRFVAGTALTAAGLVVVGVLLLNDPLRAGVVLAVSLLAVVGAVALARWVDRPEVQSMLMRRLERGVVRAQQAGRATGAQAGRVGRDVTSRARRAGEERAARPR